MELSIFTHADRQSATHDRWQRLLEARIAELRETNDAHTLDDRETARVRGRIAECKELLALATAPASTEDGPSFMGGPFSPSSS